MKLNRLDSGLSIPGFDVLIPLVSRSRVRAIVANPACLGLSSMIPQWIRFLLDELEVK
jgi:hypothetical protein